MSVQLLPYLLLVGFFAVWIIFARRGANSLRRIEGPRDRRKQQKRSLLGFGPALLLSIWLFYKGNPAHGVCAGFLLLGFLRSLYSLTRTPTEGEARENYRVDSGLCGRCDYDLTGNRSGVCPECGWQLQSEALPVDSSEWWLWWRGWRIASLENWKGRLAEYLYGVTVYVATGAIITWLTGWWGFLLLLSIPVLHCLINAIRVLQYAHSRSWVSESSRL